MNEFSFQQEKRVTVQTYKPTAASLLALLKQHDENTDTDLREWAVDIEKVANELSSHTLLAPGNRHRWEITLTRSIR